MSEMPRKEASSTRLALTLGAAGLLSGLAIVVGSELTSPVIAANQARALRGAVFRVVPGATKMQKLVRVDGALTVAADDDDSSGIYATYDDADQFRGYAMVGEGAGFQDTIVLIFGYAPNAERIVGMEVLESRETPGLGDKIYKDESFVAAFRSLAARPEVLLVKKGEGGGENTVDAITGATISSRAVVNIINGAIGAWVPLLPAPGSEPAFDSKGAAR